jgi:hypothetical protein
MRKPPVVSVRDVPRPEFRDQRAVGPDAGPATHDQVTSETVGANRIMVGSLCSTLVDVIMSITVRVTSLATGD